MTDTVRDCPQCNIRMEYRLGIFECPRCGREETAGQQQAVSGPGLVEKPRLGYDRAAIPGRAPATAYQSRHTQQAGEDPPGFKLTWELGKEKMYLMLAYTGFNLFSLVISLAALRGIGAGAGTSAGEIIFSEMIDLAVLAAVLYIPLKCMKYVVGCYLTLVLILGVLGLFFSMLFIPLMGLVLGGGGGFLAGALGFLGILITVVDLGLKAWLASVLFRELY